MKRQRRVNTNAEIAVRRALHTRGLRYRLHVRILPGIRRAADVVFPSARVALFIDGCYWHGCPDHGTWPKANAQWWRDKINANRLRDRDTDARLADAGWTVLRAWEHEDPDAVADQVSIVVRAAQ